MADPAVWQALIETGNPYVQQERQQKGLMGMMQLQEKQRELEDSQRLRQLYMSGRQPSMQEIMSVSPQLGIEMQKAQFQNMYQMQQMEKLQREQQEANAKTYAQYVGPIADTYFMDIEQGMKPEMAQQKYHSAIGNAQAELEKKHGISPTGDFRQFSPEQVLQRSVGLGVPSRYYQRQEEMQKRMMPPAMSPEQYYGGVEMTPYGAMKKPSIRQDTGFTKATAEDIGMLQQAYDAEQDPTAKQKIGGLLNQLKQQVGAGLSQSQFITPEQRFAMQAESESAMTKAREGAKAEVGREEEGKRITDAFKRAIGSGGVSRVMKLIQESTSGPTEIFGADIYKRIPQPGGSKATKGMESIGSLETIAGELRKTIERSPGAQSDKDVAIAALDSAAIADPTIPYNQRMKGFLEFTRIIKERADGLGIDPKELGIDVETSTGKKITEGHTEDGYRFKGGDPSDPKNWEKQ